jgi:hypothetical protein
VCVCLSVSVCVYIVDTSAGYPPPPHPTPQTITMMQRAVARLSKEFKTLTKQRGRTGPPEPKEDDDTEIILFPKVCMTNDLR